MRTRARRGSRSSRTTSWSNCSSTVRKPGGWSATFTSVKSKQFFRAFRRRSSTSALRRVPSSTRPISSSTRTSDEDDDDDDDEEDAGDDGGATPSRGRRAKAPPIQDLLKRGQEILVQISKEPISTKGPRVTAQISLAGRFLVYMPFASRVGVSRKIGERAERQRLREQVQSVLPPNSGGVIVRTVGEDVTPGDVRAAS